jgi:Protein of unknown function (DUF2281).
MPTQPIQQVMQKLQTLSPERLAEVEDFIDFLAAKERGNAFDAFLSVAEAVAKTGIPALSAEEIEAEIQAYRNERRRAAGA